MGTHSVGLGRDFIQFIKPVLGISQDRIRKITITADINDVTIVDVICLGQLNLDGVNLNEITIPGGVNKRFIISVEEITDDQATKS